MPIYETFFQSLEERGWAVADDTIPKDLPGRLYDECRDLWRTGRFRPAQVGRNSRQTYRGDIRGDSICWLEPDSAGAASLEFLSWITGFRDALNRAFFLGLNSEEFHFRSEEHTSELQSLM